MKETRDGKNIEKKKWNKDRYKSAENVIELWVGRIQVEEEKVDYRARKGERRNEVTGGIESEWERKETGRAARVEISLRVANDPDGRAATATR